MPYILSYLENIVLFYLRHYQQQINLRNYKFLFFYHLVVQLAKLLLVHPKKRNNYDVNFFYFYNIIIAIFDYSLLLTGKLSSLILVTVLCFFSQFLSKNEEFSTVERSNRKKERKLLLSRN